MAFTAQPWEGDSPPWGPLGVGVTQGGSGPRHPQLHGQGEAGWEHHVLPSAASTLPTGAAATPERQTSYTPWAGRRALDSESRHAAAPWPGLMGLSVSSGTACRTRVPHRLVESWKERRVDVEPGNWLPCGGRRLPKLSCPSLGGASPREEQTIALTISPSRSL